MLHSLLSWNPVIWLFIRALELHLKIWLCLPFLPLFLLLKLLFILLNFHFSLVVIPVTHSGAPFYFLSSEYFNVSRFVILLNTLRVHESWTWTNFIFHCTVSTSHQSPHTRSLYHSASDLQWSCVKSFLIEFSFRFEAFRSLCSHPWDQWLCRAVFWVRRSLSGPIAIALFCRDRLTANQNWARSFRGRSWGR